MLHFLRGTDLFNHHSNKDAIKNILAVLMISVVNADKKSSAKEQKKILDFYRLEFGMNKDTTIDLFNSLAHDNAELNSSLVKLKDILQNDAEAKAKVLHHLNSVIICDGCVDEEYEVFEKIKSFLI